MSLVCGRRGPPGGGGCRHVSTSATDVSHAHLYLSALNHGAVKSLSCSFRVTTICECYKTESLHARQTKHALKTASLKKQRATKMNINALRNVRSDGSAWRVSTLTRGARVSCLCTST